MNRRRWVIVGKAVVVFHLWLFFLAPIRLFGGLLSGVAEGIGWAKRDFDHLFMAVIMAWSDAVKPRRDNR